MDLSPVTEPLYPRVLLEERRLQHKLDLFRLEVWGIRGLCSCGVVVDIKLDNHLLWTGDPLFDSKEGAQS